MSCYIFMLLFESMKRAATPKDLFGWNHYAIEKNINIHQMRSLIFSLTEFQATSMYLLSLW